MDEDNPQIIRHEERERAFEPAFGDEAKMEAISAHFERFVGKVQSVFHEIVSDLVHVDVHVIKPTPATPTTATTNAGNVITLFTTGMSDRPMMVPEEAVGVEGAERVEYAEVFVHLPANWLLDEKSMKLEAWYWPLRWLKILARLPHEFETWLSHGHTVPHGDPPTPVAPNTKLCCMMLVEPWWMPEEFRTLTLPDGRVIHFYAMVPLLRDEVEFKLEEGAEELIEKMRERGEGEVVEAGRKSVLK